MITAILMVVGVAVLLTASITDLRHGRIPNSATASLGGLCGLLAVAGVLGFADNSVVPALAGAATFAAVLYLPHRLRPDAMGLGDVKLAVPLGFTIGWFQPDEAASVLAVGWTLVAASSIGLIVAAVAARRRGVDLASGQAIAFAPPLSLAAASVVGLTLL